jgi:hypothetical protein
MWLDFVAAAIPPFYHPIKVTSTPSRLGPSAVLAHRGRASFSNGHRAIKFSSFVIRDKPDLSLMLLGWVAGRWCRACGFANAKKARNEVTGPLCEEGWLQSKNLA